VKDKWLLALGGLVLVAAVFALKVWQAQDACADQSGQWYEGECNFDAKRAAPAAVRQ
jgi:hypothetical protein